MAVRCPTLGPRCRQIHRKSLGNRSSQSRSAITYSLITYLFLIFSSTDVYLMLSLSNFLRNQTVFMGVAISVLVLEQPLKNRAFFHVRLVQFVKSSRANIYNFFQFNYFSCPSSDSPFIYSGVVTQKRTIIWYEVIFF